MKSVRIHPRLRLWFSRLSSLLLLFQRSPIIQLIFPEAKILGGSAVLDTATFAIATVVGLGAFDSVAGATTVVQKTPVANSTTFNATVGVAITGATAFVYGVSSTNTPAYFQLTSGSVPPGLTKGSTISNKTQSITGTPTTAGTYSITLKAWESWNNTTMTGSGGSALGTFSIVVAAAGSTPPTVVVSPTGTLTKGSPLTFTLLFSQAVSGLTTSGIAVTNGTLGTLSGSGASYTIPVTPTGQGAVTCQVKASAATNATSNPNTVSNTASVTYDSLAPTVNVSPSGTLTKGSPLTFTLLFSEPVSGLTTSGIAVTNGTLGTLSGSGTSYTIPVTPTGQGAVTCQVNASAATDAATNPNTVSNTASVTYDSLAPTVVVSPTGTLTKGSPLTFTLLFSEPVSGLTTSGIAVTNGTLGTLSGSGTSYTIPVTPTGQGAVTCQVNASAATDAATNPNTVSNTASVTYDSLAPTVVVSPSGTATLTSPVTFTLLFSEPVSGLATSGIAVTNGTLGTLSGSGASYTIPVTPTGQGAVTCQVNASAATDAATNPNTVSNTASVIYDTPYSSWAGALSADKRGPEQIPQNDGIPNLLKFAFNMDPNKPDVSKLHLVSPSPEVWAGLPAQSIVGGKLRLEFLRRKASLNPGISYTPQFCTGLSGWVDAAVTNPPTSIDGTWERVVVDDPSPGTAQRFGHVKMTQP